MPTPIIGGAIAGVGSIAGAAIGSNAANKAAKRQESAAKQANRLQKEMFDIQRADQQPWRQAGIGALSQLGNQDFQRDFTMNDFQKDPGYQFRLDEGLKAIQRSAAARGGLQSGGTLKSIGRYGQDYASNEYQNAYNRFNADRDRRFNRLSSLAGLGQTANSQVAQAGQNYANQFGNNTMGAANAAGAAGIASANQWGNALSGIGQNFMNIAMRPQAQQTQGIPMAGQSYFNNSGVA